MNITTSILNMAKKNNGIVTSEMVSAAGLSRGILKYLSDKGYLERASRGVYVLPEAWDDEFLNIQIRYKKGIYSLETSLFLCKLTDRTPNKFYLFFPSTYNLTNPKKDGLICYGLKTKGYETGITEIADPAGNFVKTYNAEKTLCDILKPRFHVDIQIISEAFKQYAIQKERNIHLLSEYAKLFHVEDKVRSYMVGLDSRATMDLDATIKNYPVNL